jgi:hypothetical protein
MYGIASPAPVCTDDTMVMGAEGQIECQVVQAPVAPAGARLVADVVGPQSRRVVGSDPLSQLSGDGEIRLTYRELTALIEDAVRNLK